MSVRAVASALIETEYSFVPHISYVRRLGQVQPGRTRPLLITVEHDEALWLIEHARNLRNSDDEYVRVSIHINADLTRAEAQAAYEIRCRRRRVRAVKTAKTAVSVNPDSELPGRTFTNSRLRGGAAVAPADRFPDTGHAAAANAAAAWTAPMRQQIARECRSTQSPAAESVQPPVSSPSTAPRDTPSSLSAIADAGTAGLAMVATGSTSAVAAVAPATIAMPASATNLAAGQSTTGSPVSTFTGGTSQPTSQ